MALVIKVLSQDTEKPQLGILVSIKRPGIIGREIPSKKTNSEGCAFFDLRECTGIVTINGIDRTQQFLTNGENVFYL